VTPVGGSLRRAIAGAVALALASWGSAAQAQCSATGTAATPAVATWTSAVASSSSSVTTLVASINAVNNVFLTQSQAFVGTPPDPAPDQQGGGVWARGAGGHFTYDTATTVGNLNLDGPQKGTVGCSNRARQDIGGVQVGSDFARLNVNGWNLHAGLTAGFLETQNQDATYQGLNAPGSFHSNLQVPFAGIYGAASFGGWLVDGQVRGGFYSSQVSDTVQGLAGQRTGARGISISGDVAYRHDLGGQWFIEPSAGFVWARTDVDSLNFPGTIVAVTGSVPPWTLAVNGIDTDLGRLSTRVGTTVRTGDMMVLQPFASVGVFHDFAPPVASALTSNFQAIGQDHVFTSTITTSGVGTYGQYGLGVVAQVVDTGWLGYVRGDYRKGDTIEGWTVMGGVRYQFVPDPAQRAAAATTAPAYTAAPDWTGFHVGANLGAGFGSARWNFPDGAAVNPHFAGVLGGGSIGYDYQAGRWVVGVEAAAGWTDAHGAAPCATGFFYNCEVGVSGLHTVTGRLGYTWDRLLAYLKTGAVVAQEQTGVQCNATSMLPAVPLTGCPVETGSRTRVGWTAGLGYEFALTRNISASGEILYFRLAGDDENLAGIAGGLERSGVMSTVGLHYRFGTR